MPRETESKSSPLPVLTIAERFILILGAKFGGMMPGISQKVLTQQLSRADDLTFVFRIGYSFSIFRLRVQFDKVITSRMISIYVWSSF